MGFQSIYKKYSFKNLKSDSEGLVKIDSKQLQELHGVLLEITDDIFELCDEKGFTCMLGGGSALGAIRHHGFIPWDDDVDLNISRLSYERFIPEFKKKYGEKYWVHTAISDPKYGTTVCRIRKKGTVLITKEDLIDTSEAGVFVDLFVIENTYDNAILRKLHGFLCMFAKVCMSCRRFYRDRKTMMKLVEGDKSQEKTSRTRIIIGFLSSFMSVEKWTLFAEKVFSMCRDENSKYVSVPSGRWHYFGEMYERGMFCNMKKIEFEGRQYPVCKGMNEYMINCYGSDYMIIPPVEKREEHVCWGIDLGDKRG